MDVLIEVLLRAGVQLRLADLAVLAALGITAAAVRAPRIAIVAMRDDDVVRAGTAFIAFMRDPKHRAVWTAGGFDPPPQ